MKTLLSAAMAALALGASSVALMAQDKEYTIALSNGWVGSEWRTQMIQEAEAAAAAWADRGVKVNLVIQSKNVDVNGQIADVKNFMGQGVNAIIVNPNSPTAFNPTFAQAKAAGILVVAVDGEVTSPDAIFVGIDQKEFATLSTRWLMEQIGGKGKVVAVHGVAGHPANQARVAGFEEVVAEYPDVEVVNQVNVDWDPAKGQQATQTILATYPDLAGIWTQDGHAEGVWRAIEASGRSIPATGELRGSFVKQWQDKGWVTAASVNPPGAMATGLNVAVLLLEGHELKDGVLGGANGNALYVPTTLVSPDNIKDFLPQLEGKPDYQVISFTVSPEELQEKFFKN